MSNEDEKALARQEMQRNLSAASQVSQMKQSVLKGKTFKTRIMDRAMEPTFLPGDVMEVGGAVQMQLRGGDLLYISYQEAFHVRRVVRQSSTGGDLAFIVDGDAEDTGTWTIQGNQIIGKVVGCTRNGEPVRLSKPRPEPQTPWEKGLYWLQDKLEQVQEQLKARNQDL